MYIYQQDIQKFQFTNVRDYISSNIESVQNYSEIVNVKNEVAVQEGTIPSTEGIPSEPTFPRAFVEFGNRLNKTDIFVTFRWNKPEFTNKMIQKYRVQYWFIENLKKIQTVDIIPVNNMILQHKVYNLKPDTMYYFKVQAHNEVGGGPYTKFINVSTTHENPILSLLSADETQYVQVLDIDLQIKFHIYIGYLFQEIAYSTLENKIYGITNAWELITCDFNLSAIAQKSEINCTKIIDFESPAYNLCIDWVARNLYWIQISNGINNIMKLDSTLSQIDVKYNFLKIKESKYLNVLPSTGYFYWMELTSDNQYIIMQSDFDGKNMKPFLKNEDNKCFCQDKLLDSTSILHIDTTNIDKPLIYWTLKDRLIAADIYGCGCNLILRAGNQIKFDSLTIDKTNIYWYSVAERSIYILKKEYALLEHKGNAFKYIQKIFFFSEKTQLTVLDKTLQPYPPTICLTPNMKDYRVKVETTTANSIFVSLPEPVPNDGCEKYNLATTIYTISVSYLACLDNGLTKLKEFKERSYKRTYKIQYLTPLTEYTLKLALSNFYFDKLSMNLQYDAGVKLTTISGKLNAPEDVMVRVLMPTVAVVYWTPPKNLNCVAVYYQVSWMQLANNTETRKATDSYELMDKPEHTLDGKFFTIIQSLLPEQIYNIFVSVYPINYENPYELPIATFSTKTVYMKPNNLILSGVSTDSMNISLISSVNLTIHTEFNYTLEYKNYGMLEWHIANSTKFNNDKITFYIKNLLPRTLYKFRLILRYPKHKDDFIWTSDGKQFTFETLGNVPSAPGIPTVTRLPNFMYQLNWEPAQARDSQVTLYRVEGLIVENNYKEGNQTNKNKDWNLYYNGTSNYWIITRDMNHIYRFRVQAENAYGFGEWSESSADIDLTEISIEISSMQYYLPLILSLIITLVICNVYYFYCLYRQRKKINEVVLPPIITDIELATLNEIPSGNLQFNLLYSPRLQYNQNEFDLTIIEKRQITLGKFLGSGAFGKVFQGTVKDFGGSDIMPVAIKMLRKNASSQEKEKFLQEAKLMNQFRHKHVIRFLGICSDADSRLLILELMEAGDLLKYLRESRTLQPSDSHALRLQDLLAMCEDVARGCCYLEKQHFVHRDLACRNCLISARNRENRIVKIGDFGLARDIYKDDYYRMKGEGLLPVRWMAPESLMDGIFTSQSDVWAFGVLMWEITSLGQQPYPAKSNSEILQYVCAGSKLSKPLNCPPTLYQLMLRCWNAVNERPNFIVCLKNIVTLRDNIGDTILRAVDFVRHTEVNRS